MRKKRTVELFKVNWSAINEDNEELTFNEFLSIYLHEYNLDTNDRDTYFKVKRENEDFLIGSITTTKTYGIPCKNNKRNHIPSRLDIADDEGLGYSNVLLFDKKYQVLYYEFNQNGCWIQSFIDFIRDRNLRLDAPYQISISCNVILRRNSYQRLISSTRFKKLHLKIAFPDQMVLEDDQRNNSIKNAIINAAKASPDTLELLLNVDTRRTNASLNQGRITNTINWLYSQIGGRNSEHYQKVEFTSFAPGEDDGIENKDTIDLANDKFRRTFFIEEPRIRSDLQISEKVLGIIEVYSRCLPDIRLIFRS